LLSSLRSISSVRALQCNPRGWEMPRWVGFSPAYSTGEATEKGKPSGAPKRHVTGLHQELILPGYLDKQVDPSAPAQPEASCPRWKVPGPPQRTESSLPPTAATKPTQPKPRRPRRAAPDALVPSPSAFPTIDLDFFFWTSNSCQECAQEVLISTRVNFNFPSWFAVWGWSFRGNLTFFLRQLEFVPQQKWSGFLPSLLTDAEEALAGAAQLSWAAGGSSQKRRERVLHPAMPPSLCRGHQRLRFQTPHTSANATQPSGEEVEAEGATHGPNSTQVVRERWRWMEKGWEATSFKGRNPNLVESW